MLRDPLPLLEVMRRKLHWLEGFADCQEHPMLRAWVADFRGVLNRYEQELKEAEEATDGSR